MKSIIFIIFSIFLFGCAEVMPRQFTGPNGNKAFAVSCNDMPVCYEKIGDACKGKYEIINVNSDNASFPHGGEMIFIFRHTIAVECKD